VIVAGPTKARLRTPTWEDIKDNSDITLTLLQPVLYSVVQREMRINLQTFLKDGISACMVMRFIMFKLPHTKFL